MTPTAQHAVFHTPNGTRYLGAVLNTSDDRAEMRPLWQLDGDFAIDVTGARWTHTVDVADLTTFSPSGATP